MCSKCGRIFSETTFLGAVISKFVQAGFLAEVKTAGGMHVYKVLSLPPGAPDAAIAR